MKFKNYSDETVADMLTMLRNNISKGKCLDKFKIILEEYGNDVISLKADTEKHIKDGEKFKDVRANSKCAIRSTDAIAKDIIVHDIMEFMNNFFEVYNVATLYADTYADADSFSLGINTRVASKMLTRCFLGVDRKYHKQVYFKNVFNYFHTDCHRDVIVRSYIDSIVKAVIQTARRKLNLDTNSKHFN